MTVSDQFKQALKEGNIEQALQLALSEATELEITTWVRAANPYNANQQIPENAPPGHRMRTAIDIVEGQINTEVGSHFVGNGPYTELREFHVRQIEESRNVLQQNLESLQQLFVVLAGSMKQLSRTQPLEPSAKMDRNSLNSSKPSGSNGGE